MSNPQQSEIVMFDSPEAAEPHTMSGWLSRRGLFFNFEDDARYDGCTHRPCRKCGEPAEKIYTACPACRKKAKIEHYWQRPPAEWDGKAMLFSDATDEFFESIEDAEDWLKQGQSLDDIRLIICKPIHVRPLDVDYVHDDLPEDCDAPPEVEKAIDAFNKAVEGIILSWEPGKYRLERSS